MNAVDGEQRRAPRTQVDVEARMRLKDQSTVRGIIVNLSFMGSLFLSLAERPMKVKNGTMGVMRFAMPTSLQWLEPRIIVKRATMVPLGEGNSAQAFGFEFAGVTEEEQRAIATGCEDWAEHIARIYPLAARCQVESITATKNFKRYGRIVAGGRDVMRIRLQGSMAIDSGIRVRLLAETAYVGGTVRQVVPSPQATELVVDLDPDWGRDFFLHDVRRQALSLVKPVPAPR
jgi:hypothetical protein